MIIPLKNTLKEGSAEAPVVSTAGAISERPLAAGGTAKAKTSRISWVDHARGIAIMLVVYRHVVMGLRRSGVSISDTMDTAQQEFYNFLMRVLFILSRLLVARRLRD